LMEDLHACRGAVRVGGERERDRDRHGPPGPSGSGCAISSCR
jgi:hypothetical protein